ncbi:amidohydrolase [Myxococcota bacterium]|nr:amidohydrolase [Myxococcota bacterium]
MDKDILVNLRHTLHSLAEESSMERRTGEFLRGTLESFGVPRIVSGEEGNGLWAVFAGREQGPTVLLRSDMDALPIAETGDLEYASLTPGVSHRCGHDGHMAIMLGVANGLVKNPPLCGTVILMFQPSEETGQGALQMLSHDLLREFSVDYAFALHNLPGYPEGTVVVDEGTFASASEGISVVFQGKTSHASEPHLGVSPASAVAQLILAINGLAQLETGLDDHARATVIHARVGEEAFGTSPGWGVVMATLRSYDTLLMAKLEQRIRELAMHIAAANRLTYNIALHEVFAATVNDSSAVSYILAACEKQGAPVTVPGKPFPWSEDFGYITDAYAGALFGLGSGEGCHPLHSDRYDFPDGILPAGVSLFLGIVRSITGGM